MLNRKLLEKQRVQNYFVSHEVHIGYFCYNVNATVSFGNHAVYIQISKFFTRLTDWQMDINPFAHGKNYCTLIIKLWFQIWVNLLHPISSLPSVQSRVPSQRSKERTHWRLLHRKPPLEHETETVSSWVRLKSQRLLQHPTTLSWKHCKLTAVPLITSIRACPGPSTSCGGGNTLAIGTPKLGGATSYVCVEKNEYRYVTICTLLQEYMLHTTWNELRVNVKVH